MVLAGDGCDDDTPVVFDEVRTDGGCDHEYSLLRTWTATDRTGNSASETQTVHIVDGVPPTVAPQPNAPSCLFQPHQEVGYAAFTGVTGGMWDMFDNCADTEDLQVTVNSCNSTQVQQSGAFSDRCFYDSATDSLFVSAEGITGSESLQYTAHVTVADTCGTSAQAKKTFTVYTLEELKSRAANGEADLTTSACTPADLSSGDVPAH
jgi:hypothetical protein